MQILRRLFVEPFFGYNPSLHPTRHIYGSQRLGCRGEWELSNCTIHTHLPPTPQTPTMAYYLVHELIENTLELEGLVELVAREG